MFFAIATSPSILRVERLWNVTIRYPGRLEGTLSFLPQLCVSRLPFVIRHKCCGNAVRLHEDGSFNPSEQFPVERKLLLAYFHRCRTTFVEFRARFSSRIFVDTTFSNSNRKQQVKRELFFKPIRPCGQGRSTKRFFFDDRTHFYYRIIFPRFPVMSNRLYFRDFRRGRRLKRWEGVM